MKLFKGVMWFLFFLGWASGLAALACYGERMDDKLMQENISIQEEYLLKEIEPEEANVVYKVEDDNEEEISPDFVDVTRDSIADLQYTEEQLEAYNKYAYFEMYGGSGNGNCIPASTRVNTLCLLYVPDNIIRLMNMTKLHVQVIPDDMWFASENADFIDVTENSYTVAFYVRDVNLICIKESELNKPLTFLHELGHFVDNHTGQNKKPKRSNGRDFRVIRNNEYENSMSEPNGHYFQSNEFFANSFAFYSMSKALKGGTMGNDFMEENNPNTFDFIKEAIDSIQIENRSGMKEGKPTFNNTKYGFVNIWEEYYE